MTYRGSLLVPHVVGLAIALIVCGVSADRALAESSTLPVTSVAPANGATIPLPSGRIPFEIQSSVVFNGPSCNGGLPYVSVSTQDLLDEIPGSFEGQLASDFRVDYFLLAPSQAYPGLDSGVSGYVPNGYWWSSTPGTYYWQVQGSCSSPFTQYVSPVYTLVIAPPVPAPASAPAPATVPAPSAPTPNGPAAYALTLSHSRATVKQAILERTGRSPHDLSDKCRSISESRARCKASWASATRFSSTTLLYAGDFNLEQTSEGTFYSFTGLRERAGCARHHSAKHCASNMHWPESYAP